MVPPSATCTTAHQLVPALIQIQLHPLHHHAITPLLRSAMKPRQPFIQRARCAGGDRRLGAIPSSTGECIVADRVGERSPARSPAPLAALKCPPASSRAAPRRYGRAIGVVAAWMARSAQGARHRQSRLATLTVS
jgi:hypothetical protein